MGMSLRNVFPQTGGSANNYVSKVVAANGMPMPQNGGKKHKKSVKKNGRKGKRGGSMVVSLGHVVREALVPFGLYTLKKRQQRKVNKKRSMKNRSMKNRSMKKRSTRKR
jgi:hypothetical protein